MATFTGTNGTVSFKIDNITDGTIYDNDKLLYRNNEMKMQWLTKKSKNLKPGLVFFVEERNDFFCDNPEKRIECRLVNWDNYTINWDNYKFVLLITGFELPQNGSPLWNKQFDAHLAIRGKIEDGASRHVYEYVGCGDGLGFYAGLTVHDACGSWSGWKMHEFEEVACGAPLQVYPDFSEKFAYVTQPEYMWGLQTQSFAWEKIHQIIPFKDMDIISVPMGAHFSVAGPGTRLAYVWTYSGAGKKNY